MKFYGLTLAWGEDFVTRFLEYCCPTLMADGNLPHLVSYFENYEHLICTRREDWEVIIRSRAYNYMTQCFDVRPIYLDGWDLKFKNESEKYRILSRLIAWGLGHFDHDLDGWFCTSPDTVWSDGLGISIVNWLKRGKGVYFIKPIRVWEANVLGSIRGNDYQDIISLSPRELVRISINNLHHDWSYFEVHGDNHAVDEKCIWRVGKTGLLVRSMYPSPVVVCPQSPEHFVASLECNQSPLDSKLYSVACPDEETYHFQGDSDEGAIVELCVHERTTPKYAGRGSKSGQYAFFLSSAMSNDDVHFQADRMNLNFRYHTEDLDESWGPVEQEADRFMEKTLESLNV